MKKMLIAASAIGASIAGMLLYLRNRNSVQKNVNSGNGVAAPLLQKSVRDNKYSMG